MSRLRQPLSSPVPSFSALCVLRASELRSLPSPFKFELSTATFSSLTPFAATLTDPLQLVENATASSPGFATLTSRVTHKSRVCHSYKKHAGVGHLHSVPAKVFFLFSRYPFPIPFRIRTSRKWPNNSFGICTSKTQDLKSFRIRTYEKTGGGCPFLSPDPLSFTFDPLVVS
jgi:hypothetical protein